MKYYFRLLCFEYKICSVGYFLDEMLQSELSFILEQIEYADRSLWESQRLTCLFIAQKMCSKKLKLTDCFSLPWDAKNEEINKEDFAELRQHQQQIEDYINSQTQTKTDIQQ